MRLRGAFRIAATPSATWELLLSPLALADCVPGARDVRQVDERRFEGTVHAAVGPMDGEFVFTATIEEAVFPDALVVRIEGADTVTRSRLDAAVRARVAEADGGTELAYDASVGVHGRLAILGEMVMRATASLMIDGAVGCLRRRLEAADAAGADAVPGLQGGQP
ncbi:MAG: CoxG family protein [Candidatus Limnocylindrales bacterium]